MTSFQFRHNQFE